MKIGELFVALGFKVDAEPLERTERQMEAAAIKAGKLALVVNAVNVAMLAMVDSAMRAAVSLRLWEQTTGGSTEELQRWGNAARIVGLQANDLKAAVESLQDARNAFALGEPQNVGAWSILGVDPTQDPFAVLKALRARLAATKDANLMRGLLNKVGMAGVMPLLQLPESQFIAMQRATVLQRDQITALVDLNREWQRLKIGVTVTGQQLSAALVPSLRLVLNFLQDIAAKLSTVVSWLNSASEEAKNFRIILGTVVAGFLALGAGLAIATVAAAGLMLVTSPLVAALSVVGAGVVALILMLDDLWTAAEGGEHVFDWGDAKLKVDALTAGLKGLLTVVQGLGLAWGELSAAVNSPGQFIKDLVNIVGGDNKLAQDASANRGEAWFAPTNRGATGNWSQENNVEINVDGSGDPAATANAVNRTIKKELESAAYQMPVPNY